MLVTDKGQLIRCPVEGIRIAGRSTQGVIVFDTAEDEHVVSVEHIGEDTENGNGNDVIPGWSEGPDSRAIAHRESRDPGANSHRSSTLCVAPE